MAQGRDSSEPTSSSARQGDGFRGYSIPCDAARNVDIDSLSDGARNNYFFAHSVIGRDVAMPAVRHCGLH